MKVILAPIVAIIGVVLGGGGAIALKSSATTNPSTESADYAEDGGSEDGKQKTTDDASSDKKEAKKKDKGSTSGTYDNSVYYKFSREFVVPILEDGKVASLVIINLHIEADPKISQELFRMDPKLRDNIMTTLIALSGDGRTFNEVTNVNTYETLRATIRKNLEAIVPNGVRNILIVDMAKQDL